MQICIEKHDYERAPLGDHHQLPLWLLRSKLHTCPVYRTHLSKFLKNGAKRCRFESNNVTTNEPLLGGHRHLPSWLLRSQVCTPTQCLGHIFASALKKWPKMMQKCIEKCDNERAPSNVKKK